MEQSLRSAFAAVPAGVAVVSVPTPGGHRGITVSSLVSVSAEPALALVSLERVTRARDLVAAAGLFNVSVLARNQEFFAERFAGRAPTVNPLWEDVPHEPGRNGLPLLSGAVAWLECELRDIHAAGDHDLVIGLVSRAGRGPGEPLVLWDRSFWSLA